LLCLLGPIPSGAQDQGAYSFVLLAERQNAISLGRLGRPSINNTGTVAFLDRHQGIWVVGDRRSALIATTEEFAFGNLAAINDAGHVAFYVQLIGCTGEHCSGIMVGDERRRTFAVDPNDPNFSFTQIVDPTLNNRGTVAFVDPPQDVFTVGPEGTQLLGHFEVGPDAAGGKVVIADSGLVVFPAFPDYPTRLVLFLHDGRELKALAEVDGNDGIRIWSAYVNSAGQVVFSVGPCCSGGEHRLYLWDRGRFEDLVQLHTRRCPLLGGYWYRVRHNFRDRFGCPVEGMRHLIPFGHEVTELGLEVGL
jgi:hypothetical protein